MKKLLKIIALVGILSLASCSQDCNQNCGEVYHVIAYINLPSNGDETYQIDYKTECGEIRQIIIPFNLSNGLPGEINQPVQKVLLGDTYCD